MLTRLVRVASLLTLCAGTVAAQQPAPTGPSPLVALRGTLRTLTTMQEKYYAANSRYANTLDALKALGFDVPAKVSVKLLEAKPNGWSASASHADVAGATCVDWVGPVGEVAVPMSALDGRSGAEGEPMCDAAVAVVETQQLADMASALRNLLVAEEKYWAEHGTYTTELAALGLYPQPKPRPPFLAQVIAAGGRGWSGIAVNRRLNKSCVIYVGTVDELAVIPRTVKDRILPSSEGAPACEKP